MNIMDGNAEDLDKECVDFEAKLKEAGGVDLFIAGSAQVLPQLSYSLGSVADCSWSRSCELLLLSFVGGNICSSKSGKVLMKKREIAVPIMQLWPFFLRFSTFFVTI